MLIERRVALSESAVATVAIVQVQGGTLTVMGTQRIDNPGQVPISFDVPLDANVFDPTLETELWATITDGDNAWATGEGVAVATNGAPSQGVVVELTFRPDLLEGQVTGFISGTGDELSENGYFMTWVMSEAGDVLGVDNQLAGGGEPIPLAVPFRVADVDIDDALRRARVRQGRRRRLGYPGGHAGHHRGQPVRGRRADRRPGRAHTLAATAARQQARRRPRRPAAASIRWSSPCRRAGVVGVVVVVMFMRR